MLNLQFLLSKSKCQSGFDALFGKFGFLRLASLHKQRNDFHRPHQDIVLPLNTWPGTELNQTPCVKTLCQRTAMRAKAGAMWDARGAPSLTRGSANTSPCQQEAESSFLEGSCTGKEAA